MRGVWCVVLPVSQVCLAPSTTTYHAPRIGFVNYSPLTTPFVLLPDCRLETIRPHHRIPRLTSPRLRELSQVRKRSHTAPAGRRVRVYDDLIAQVLVGRLGAPDLGPREEEPLLRGEAVDGGRPRFAGERVLERRVGHLQ